MSKPRKDSVESVLAAIERVRKAVRSPAAAKRFLVSAGIMTPSGRLAKPYRASKQDPS